jgi:hypothetical protein
VDEYDGSDYEVEFVDADGETLALVTVSVVDLELVRRFQGQEPGASR